MNVRELRELYLRFFESKDHLRFAAGSLIPYDVTGRLDESLLFNGAGMIQFKPYFRGVARPEKARLLTCQPCVRTNDIEEVGDDTHLSFFEMLGNFSFGDYYKDVAIDLSWEFLTSPEWLGLDPQRLSFTIFEADDDAFATWSKHLRSVGIDPASRIMRLDEESNFWPAGAFSKGPPGPCGTNSEMFYWVSDEPTPGPGYTHADWVRDDAAKKWVEIWNDVFIQWEWEGHPRPDGKGYIKNGMKELPFRSIDTGMGLERTALVLGGFKTIYDTDVFQPMLAKLDALVASYGAQVDAEKGKRARRIIADHLRTASFCIAAGILPGNNGRGYVLRRLIRRATLQGQRVLRFDEPFLHIVFDGLVEAMGSFYTDLVDLKPTIVETLRSEEVLFRRTLTNGLQRLSEQMTGMAASGVTEYSGAAAFQLYDTFGFPLEISREILAEAGYTLNEDDYEAAMTEAQHRSRNAQERESVYGGVSKDDESVVLDAPETTTFVGYDATEATGRIVRMRPGNRIALDVTPFYAESGGQTGDRGALVVEGGPLDGTSFAVVNTTKSSGIFWHEISAEGELAPETWLGSVVRAQVSGGRRDRIRRNHTATHLLQAALRQVLGTHVTQAGSYVGPDNLRFDFTHSKGLSALELEQVERLVNEQALANTPVTTYVDLPIAEARAKGAMALFGEKYGDKVRMVEIGDFSRELCGGIHVRTTGEVGLFKIVSESSAAGGVRRIEAITGEGAYEWVLAETNRLREAAALLKAAPRDIVSAVERLQESVKDERKRREKAEVASMGGSSSSADSASVPVGSVVLWRRDFGDADPKLAASAVDKEADGKPNQVTVAALVTNGKPQFIGKAGAGAVASGAHVGNLLKELARITEGGGGGRADFATAGGKNVAKIPEALEAAPGILGSMLKPA